jgi:L-cysteine desulfidase
MFSDDYKPVYLTTSPIEAESIRILLESFGINAQISQESAGTALGLTIGPLGETLILVKEADEQAAKEILKSMDDGKLEVQDGD